MNIQEFTTKFREIKQQRWIPITRTGDGKFGNTLEDMLGLKENNLDRPDIEGHELKVQKSDTGSRMTLFSKESWVGKPKDYIDKFGWQHLKHKNSKTIQTSIISKPNKRGFYNTTDEKYMYVYNTKDNTMVNKIAWKTLCDTFEKKIPKMISVHGEDKIIDGKPHFWYTKAYLMSGSSAEKFRQLVENDVIVMEYKCYYKYNENRLRNRGTSFRINECHLHKLFGNITEIK